MIPGWGHIYLGKEGRGLVLFTLYAIAFFVFLNAISIYMGPSRQALFTVSGVVSVALLIYSVSDTVRISSPRRLERVRRLCDELLWEGMTSFLRCDYDAAEEKFLECSRLDGLDVEPVFRAGVIAARRREIRQAEILFKRARRLDVHYKWDWEIERELQRLAEPSESQEDTDGELQRGGS